MAATVTTRRTAYYDIAVPALHLYGAVVGGVNGIVAVLDLAVAAGVITPGERDRARHATIAWYAD